MDTRVIIQATQWFIVLSMVVAISSGQSVSLTGPSGVKQGDNLTFTCTTLGINSPNFIWYDGTTILFLMIAGTNQYNQQLTKYSNFDASSSGMSSTMTITDAAFEDDGSYSCSASGYNSDPIDLTVEAKSNVTLTVNTTVLNNTYMYEAACEAIGARPEESITWTIGNITQSSGIVETDPDVSHDTLWDKRSLFTFPATKENYNQTLTCHVSGHQLSDFNWQKSIRLDFHNPPTPDNIVVTFVIKESNLTVSCDLNGAKGRPTPAITNYYIYANDGLIHESSQGENDVNVPVPDEVMDFTCLAGNYLGNATGVVTYEPPSGDLLDDIEKIMEGLPFASVFSEMTGGQILSIIVVISVVTLISIILNIVQWFTK